MNNTTKILLIAGSAVAVYLLIKNKDKVAEISGGANQGTNKSNADGVSGTNTCKPPREVIGGLCVLRGQGKAPAMAMPKKVSPMAKSIVQRGY